MVAFISRRTLGSSSAIITVRRLRAELGELLATRSARTAEGLDDKLCCLLSRARVLLEHRHNTRRPQRKGLWGLEFFDRDYHHGHHAATRSAQSDQEVLAASSGQHQVEYHRAGGHLTN